MDVAVELTPPSEDWTPPVWQVCRARTRDRCETTPTWVARHPPCGGSTVVAGAARPPGPHAVAARPRHAARQLARRHLLGAELDRPLAQVGRQVVVVALEAVARDAELRGERVQLVEPA